MTAGVLAEDGDEDDEPDPALMATTHVPALTAAAVVARCSLNFVDDEYVTAVCVEVFCTCSVLPEMSAISPAAAGPRAYAPPLAVPEAGAPFAACPLGAAPVELPPAADDDPLLAQAERLTAAAMHAAPATTAFVRRRGSFGDMFILRG